MIHFVCDCHLEVVYVSAWCTMDAQDADVCLCRSAYVCWHVWMCVNVRRCAYLCNLHSMVIVIYFSELKFEQQLYLFPFSRKRLSFGDIFVYTRLWCTRSILISSLFYLFIYRRVGWVSTKLRVFCSVCQECAGAEGYGSICVNCTTCS